jgi:hypothetical protein
MTKPQTDFDWAIYANATCAGLAALIPIPIIDWLFEEFFRRQMPVTIARRRDRKLSGEVIGQLNRNLSGRSYFMTCLLLPFTIIIWLITKISRKILYVLTIKEATDKISQYWHQAFLMDYMLQQGHLDSIESTKQAQKAMGQVMDTITISPFNQLANQIISGSHHIYRSLRSFRQGDEDETMQQAKSEMSQHWVNYERYLRTLAVLYDQLYQQNNK